MLRSILTAMAGVAATAAPAAAQVVAASAPVNPHAMELFDRDAILMNWALRTYDRDGDVQLSPSEAQAAADGLKDIADSNHDGRVTPQEYRSAREFIVARF